MKKQEASRWSKLLSKVCSKKYESYNFIDKIISIFCYRNIWCLGSNAGRNYNWAFRIYYTRCRYPGKKNWIQFCGSGAWESLFNYDNPNKVKGIWF